MNILKMAKIATKVLKSWNIDYEEEWKGTENVSYNSELYLRDLDTTFTLCIDLFDDGDLFFAAIFAVENVDRNLYELTNDYASNSLYFRPYIDAENKCVFIDSEVHTYDVKEVQSEIERLLNEFLSDKNISNLEKFSSYIVK